MVPKGARRVPIIPIVVVVLFAAFLCGATMIPLYDCGACNGTGWNQGLRGIDMEGRPPDKCHICSGTLRISLWSRTHGAHARFMSHFE
jgi:hypothetical protein